MQRGFTLIELLIVVLLIPLVGITIVHLDMFSHRYFQRTTGRMVPEQEVELALGSLASDILLARDITVYGSDWVTVVPPGAAAPGDRIELTIDDDNDDPPDPTNDDVIRYWLDGTGQVIRQYAVDGGGFDPGRPVARNIQALEFLQTMDEPTFDPPNVVRATVRTVWEGITVERTRYVTSRTRSAIP